MFKPHNQYFFELFLGDVCMDLLHYNGLWTAGTTLIELLTALVNLIDHPDLNIPYSISESSLKFLR